MTERKKSSRPKKPPHNARFAVVVVRSADGPHEAPDVEDQLKREPNAKGEARAKCEAFGQDAMVEAIVGGVPLRLVAEHIGVSVHALWEWINADRERSQACARARVDAAQAYDELAEHVLLTAPGLPAEIQRAAQLAQHYRWRAKVVNPKVYGDKAEVQHTHRLSVADALKQLDERRRQQQPPQQ